MIRSLILAAACSLGALVPALVPVLRGGNGGAWDPRESRASLFLGATGRGESRSVYRRTVETFRNWTDKAPASGTTGFVIGRAEDRRNGVTISLISLVTATSTLDGSGICPELAAKGFVSVNDNTTGSTCSTDNTGTRCSVTWINGPAGGSCSTNANAFYCSAGPNSAPLFCSTAGNSTGTISCSAVAANTECSTTDSPPLGTTPAGCSAYGGIGAGAGQQQQCSTGSLAGPDAGASTACSSMPPAASAQGGFCSVTNGGVQGGLNICSTDGGANQTCSAFTNAGFCSVSANSPNMACTVLGANPAASSKCSAQVAGATNCSIMGAPNIQQPPPGGVCAL